jgi:6-pyruvoyltetrahydropterin/6-carboxytetrahydropterin synthase
MDKFRATKTVEFDYGHRVPRHDSKCRNIHGHRGKVEVTVEGCLTFEGSSSGMVMDFGHIKQIMNEEIVDRLDHCCIIDAGDTELKEMFGDAPVFHASNIYGQRYPVPGFGIVQELAAGAPTAELLAFACFQAIYARLPETITLKMVRFWETPNSVAEYSGPVESYKIAYVK